MAHRKFEGLTVNEIDALINELTALRQQKLRHEPQDNSTNNILDNLNLENRHLNRLNLHLDDIHLDELTPPPKPSDTWQVSDLCPQLHSKIITLDSGIRLCIEVGGDPKHPPILLITGLGSQLMFWSNELVCDLIKQGFFVVRFDNRDTGLSSKINSPAPKKIPKLFLGYRAGGTLKTKLFDGAHIAYDLYDMATDVVGLIHALRQSFGIGAVHLMGASMGGIIAQIVAAKSPTLVKSLTLMFTTTSERHLPMPTLSALYTFIKKPPSLSERDMVRHAVWFTNVVGTQGHQGIRADRNLAKLRYNRDFDIDGFSRQLTAILKTGDISAHTKKISAPTLVLHGNKDQLLPIKHGKRVARLIKNAKFVAVAGMAHDIPVYYQPFLIHMISQHIKKNQGDV